MLVKEQINIQHYNIFIIFYHAYQNERYPFTCVQLKRILWFLNTAGKYDHILAYQYIVINCVTIHFSGIPWILWYSLFNNFFEKHINLFTNRTEAVKLMPKCLHNYAHTKNKNNKKNKQKKPFTIF